MRATAPHHAPGGGFRDPWAAHPEADRRAWAFLRWQMQRMRQPQAPNPRPDDIPRQEPDPARPRAGQDETRLTWIGHATFLIQVHGLNLLTDPVFSRRASPFEWWGPARFTPPGLALDELPPVDAVLLSHDHYDHLDSRSVEGLRARFGPDLAWIAPLGYRAWFARHGVENVRELDWWQKTVLEAADGSATVICLPARHWSRRRWRANGRLWASWAVLNGLPEGARGRSPAPEEPPSSGSSREPRGVYFGGDSGWCPAFQEIGDRLGPFRASLLPIGAYEPRWFMAPAHMNPEEAVRAYRALGGRGIFVGMHWGTFRLTDEDPLEPPGRTRQAWEEAGLTPEDLRLPGIGGTLVV